MSAITVRNATEADLDLIVTLIGELAEYEKLRDACVVTTADLRKHLFGARPVAEGVIGELDGTPEGFALFFTSFSTFVGKPGLYLEDLYVRSHARGVGLGKALLLHLVQLARDRNYGRVEWSVLDWNEPSIAFYKKLGAVPMEEWTVYRLDEESIDRLIL